MKSFLLFILFIVVSSENLKINGDKLAPIKCVLTSEKFYEFISNVIKKITTEKEMNVGQTITNNIGEVVNIIKSCLNKKEEKLLTKTLYYTQEEYDYLLFLIDFIGPEVEDWFLIGGFPEVRARCIYYYGYKWFCKNVPRN